ncbi:MAG: cation transporter [Comamonadaceae bacterium]|nr:cation transporter [Comamonadaceae bacterium]
MQVSAYLKLSIAVARGHHRAEDRRLVGHRHRSACCPTRWSRWSTWPARCSRWRWSRWPRGRPTTTIPYGHHKAEYFSSGFEGVLIFVAALAIIWAAVQRLLAPAAAGAAGPGPGAVGDQLGAERRAGLGDAAQGARARARWRSKADARHLFTDVWTSAGVVGRPAGGAWPPAGSGWTRCSRSRWR